MRLLLDPAEPFRPEVEADEQRWPIMYAAVEAASESAAKTAIDAVISAIENCNGKAIIYQETAGTDRYVMHPNVWGAITSGIAAEQTDKTGLLQFTFRGSRPNVNTGGGTGNLSGQAGEVVWQYQMIGGGLAGMVAEGVFGPTLSGTTVTTTALANALAWLAALKGGTVPSFVSSALKIVDVVAELVQQPNTTTGFTQVKMTVMFREVPDSVASSWPSLVQDANYGVQAVEGGPIDTRSGKNAPSTNMVLSGTFTIKTEGNTTFDSADTKVAANAVYSKALDAASTIIAHHAAVYASIGPTQVTSPTISIDMVTGITGFSVVYETSNVLEWQETWVVRNEEPAVVSRDASGRDWLYEPNGGPVTTLSHTQFVRALSSPVGYKRPVLNGNWHRMDAEVPTVTTRITSNGTLFYETSGSSTWRYLNPDPTGPSSTRSIPANIVLTDSTVANGRGDV